MNGWDENSDNYTHAYYVLYVSHITVCVRIYVLYVNHINVSDSTDTVYTVFP